LVRGWGLLPIAWLGQLVLIGGAAAILRARPSQLRAFTAGLAQLVRAILPCLAAAAAIATASLALVLPGLVLLALLSLTGASTARGPTPQPLASLVDPTGGVASRPIGEAGWVPTPHLLTSLVDSVAVARAHPRAVVLATIAMLAIDAAIVLVAQFALVAIPLPRIPAAAHLAMLPVFMHAVAFALVLASPIPATVLAAIHVRATR
jgi:hypothetical protein